MKQWIEQVDKRISLIQNKVRNNLYRDFLPKYNLENQELSNDIWKIISIATEAVRKECKEVA